MEPKTCHHCGNEWTPRKANPKKCPQCQNSLWRSSRPKGIPKPLRQSPEAEVANGDVVQHVEIMEESVAAPPQSSGSGERGKHRADSGPPRRNESEGSRPSSPIQVMQNDTLSDMKSRAEELFKRLQA